MDTVWILGDQLNRNVGALRDQAPGDVRVLMIESATKLANGRWHRQRAHLVLASMRRFAAELRAEGFDVDYRTASSMPGGLEDHRREFAPDRVVAMSPMSWDAVEMLAGHGVELLPNEQFLCSASEFAAWADGKKSLKMEDFYRWQRRRLDVLMDGTEPVAGRWNFDADNREPPPKDGRDWPAPIVDELDVLDAQVAADIEQLCPDAFGEPSSGLWATSRAGALARLDQFIDDVLPLFGPHEDSMLRSEWKLAHSALSPYLNLGLLHPGEVIEAAEAAYRMGRVPIASAEGFIRQIIGWREYVWGLYWLWMPEYGELNALNADQVLPPAFEGAPTQMACVSHTVAGIDKRGWSHHIERLMILGNLSLTAGVRPQAVVDWMWKSFVDGAEWVMVPNVIGMALFADGGRMATKPYASGGAYIKRMSDHCKGCAFDPTKRVGETACPFTTLYWDFLARNEEVLRPNHRLGNQLGSMRKLADLDMVRERATEIRLRLSRGDL
ncbi:Photolyase PhrB-like [Acidimicrobiia bacterium]